MIMANGFGVVISFLCPPRQKTYSWTAAFVNYVKSRSGKQGWVRKQGLNHAKSRIRNAWKRWVPISRG